MVPGYGTLGVINPVAVRFNANGVPSGDGLKTPVYCQIPPRMVVLRLNAIRTESSLAPGIALKMTQTVSFAARL